MQLTDLEKAYRMNMFFNLWRWITLTTYSRYLPQAKLASILILENEDRFLSTLKNSRGVILVYSHFFGQRVLNRYLVSQIESVASLGPFPKKDYLLHRAKGLKNAIACLRGKGVVLIAGDGMQGDKTIPHPFFGRKRRFQTGFAHLALQTGATVMFVDCYPEADGRFSVRFLDAVHVDKEGVSADQQIEQYVHRYAENLVRQWRERPENIWHEGLKRYNRAIVELYE